ncbi:MAG: hypothetical protein GC165_05130 [Armatimonadetes bacterium]|nr:hypothetical protein [Armatimonadota bacterium]
MKSKSRPLRLMWKRDDLGYVSATKAKALGRSLEDGVPFCMQWETDTLLKTQVMPDRYRDESFQEKGYILPRRTGGMAEDSYFDPMDYRTLHRTFGELSMTPKAVCAFADQYGLLGACCYQTALTVSPFIDFIEPLAFWYYEISEMKKLLSYWDQCRDEAKAKLAWMQIVCKELEHRNRLLSSDDNPFAYRRIFRTVSPELGKYVFPHLVRTESGMALDGTFRYSIVAKMALEFELNAKLQDWVRPTIEAISGTTILLKPKNLLGAIYALLAEEIIGSSRPVKRCEGCGKWFQPLDLRKKTCSSKCRQRAWRQHNKQTEMDNEHG